MVINSLIKTLYLCVRSALPVLVASLLLGPRPQLPCLSLLSTWACRQMTAHCLSRYENGAETFADCDWTASLCFQFYPEEVPKPFLLYMMYSRLLCGRQGFRKQP